MLGVKIFVDSPMVGAPTLNLSVQVEIYHMEFIYVLS